MLLQNWTKYICTGSILQLKFHNAFRNDAHFRAFAPCGGWFSAARASQVAPTTPRCRCDVSISIYSPPGLLLVESFRERHKAVGRVPRQPQRPKAASALRLPPVPSHGLSRRRCCRSRTQPVTLRIGIALPTERCAPPTARPPAARQQSRDARSCPCHGTPFQARDVRHSSPDSRVSATGRHRSSLI